MSPGETLWFFHVFLIVFAEQRSSLAPRKKMMSAIIISPSHEMCQGYHHNISFNLSGSAITQHPQSEL